MFLVKFQLMAKALVCIIIGSIIFATKRAHKPLKKNPLKISSGITEVVDANS